jgi:hypothetical protein
MKKDKTLLISIAAGAIVAGLAAYFMFTDKGKKHKASLSKAAGKVGEQAKAVFKGVKTHADKAEAEQVNGNKFAETVVD